MLTLEQIESAILQLTPDEFQKLLEWFADLDYQRWDEQLGRDIADGKLEALAQEAIAEFEAGDCQPI
jgi:carbon monoxide dehydrogenase subunit G